MGHFGPFEHFPGCTFSAPSAIMTLQRAAGNSPAVCTIFRSYRPPALRDGPEKEESEMKPFHQKTMKKKLIALLCALAMALCLPMSAPAAGAVLLTEEMGESSYWSERSAQPQTALVSADELEQLNADSLKVRGTGLRDLSVWQETDYNGQEWADYLREEAMNLAYDLYHDYAVRFNGDGREYTRWHDAADRLFGSMIDNCRDSDTTVGEHELFAMCTADTHLRSFPSDAGLFDDEGERDYQQRAQVLLGEPLVLKGESDDGKFVYAFSGTDSGWLRWTELGVCRSREEWLQAWQYSPEETLVVYGDGVAARPSEEEEGVRLSMGTCLRLAELEEYKRSFSFDSARPDYVVWLPQRSNSGWYRSELAVVSRSDEVSEGYLPLTGENLAQVALKQPQNAALRSGGSVPEDCSGYARALYRCFGLNLSRSVSDQNAQPLRKRSLEGLSDAAKAKKVKKLPLGSLLCTEDKEFLYLGNEGDTLCVISMVDAVDGRRSTGLDSLDSVLSDGSTILSKLTLAVVPWYNAEARDLSQAEVKGVKDAVYTGKPVTQSLTVSVDGTVLQEGVHYTLSYHNNDQVGKATVTIRGKGNWKGKLVESFRIHPAATSLTRLSGTRGGFEAQWKKRSGVWGYQLQYSREKDFTGAVTVKVKGAESTSLKVDNLKKGTWYVRVRSRGWRDGIKYGSAWSDVVQTEVK